LLVLTSPHGVLTSVKLNDELRRSSGEIANEWSDRDLPIEANSKKLPVAEMLPQLPLSTSGIFSEFARAKRGLAIVGFVYDMPSPSPSREREGS